MKTFRFKLKGYQDIEVEAVKLHTALHRLGEILERQYRVYQDHTYHTISFDLKGRQK